MRTKMENGKRNYFELVDIESFLRLNEYPKTIKEQGARSNFKRASKNFSIENGKFFYKRQRVVIMAKQRQLEIFKDVHEGVGLSTHSKAMASHRCRDSTYSKFQNASFGIQFTKMLKLTLSSVKIARNKVI